MNETWRCDFEARLRAVQWHALSHAYGEASDVPDLLLELLDEKTFEKAMYELQGNIWHQGTRYEATLVAIPFLVELLEHTPHKRAQLIDYLLHIAMADTSWHYPYGYHPELAVASYMTREFADEVYAHVQEHTFPLFLRLAQTEEDATTQRMALWALGWFPLQEAHSRPVLEKSQTLAATSALKMLDAAKVPLRERTEEEEDQDADEYEELISQIYG